MSAITTKLTAVLACTAALLGISSLATTAHAQAASTNGFHIYNESGTPLTLTGIAGDKDFASAPKIGSTLLPGEVATFELRYSSSYDYQTLRYAADGPTGIYPVVDIRIAVEGGTIPTSTCEYARALDCSRSFFHQKDITITDATDTTHELSGAEARKQADLIRRLCHDGGLATCDFDPEKQEAKQGEHVNGEILQNHTGDPQHYTVSAKQELKQSNSFGVSVTAETGFEAFGQEVDVKIKTSYEHEWSTKTGYEVSAVVTVQPGHRVQVWTTAPVLRVTGTLTVTLARSTWILHDIWFDSVDEHGSPELGTDEITSLPLEQPGHAPHGSEHGADHGAEHVAA